MHAIRSCPHNERVPRRAAPRNAVPPIDNVPRSRRDYGCYIAETMAVLPVRIFYREHGGDAES
jgi:hypothetical protein